MLAAAPLIVARLKALPGLAGWAVRDALDMEDRSALPAASVQCIGASVNAGARAGMLEPRWQITLAVAKSATAAASLDTAIEAVIGSLLGWLPPADANNRGVNRRGAGVTARSAGFSSVSACWSAAAGAASAGASSAAGSAWAASCSARRLSSARRFSSSSAC